MPTPPGNPYSLGEELAELARTNPKVAAAAKAFDDAAERIVSGRAEAAHAMPCLLANCSWHNPAYPDPPRGEELHALAIRRYRYDAEFHARCHLVFGLLDRGSGPGMGPGREIEHQIILALAVDDIVRQRMAKGA